MASGRLATSICVTTPPSVASFELINCVDSVTFTVSLNDPTSSAASTRARWPTSSVTSCEVFLKPLNSTSMRYWPGIRFTKRYDPVSVVCCCEATLVATLVIETVVPGMIAPPESLTVPVRVALSTCASTVRGTTSARSASTTRSRFMQFSCAGTDIRMLRVTRYCADRPMSITAWRQAGKFGAAAVLAAFALGTEPPLAAQAAADRAFTLKEEGEVVATIAAGCAGCDWGEAGREAAVLELSVDGTYSQHLILSRGEAPVPYRVMLGRLTA